MKTNITILTEYSKIPFYYSLKPIFEYKEKEFSFKFTESLKFCLNKDKNENLLMLRHNKELSVDLLDETMRKLRRKYKTIIYFDDYDCARIERPRLLKYVDFFLKKQLYKDRDQYLKEVYSHRMFEDYLHHQLKTLPDRVLKPNLEPNDLKKLTLAWNLGVGTYPQRNLKMKMGQFMARYISPKLGFYIGRPFSKIKPKIKRKIIHAIFSIHKHPYIDFQRIRIQELFKDDPKVLLSKVNPDQYYHLMSLSLLTLSPFGWGEICYRDFESILYKSLLIKPNMDHIETFPNTFIKNKTYISLDWDLSNLKEITEYYLNHPDEANAIASYAYKHYLEELDKTEDRLKEILDLFK